MPLTRVQKLLGCLSAALLSLALGGCQPVEPPSSPTVQYLDSDRWPEVTGAGSSWSELQQCHAELADRYMSRQAADYAWFAHAPNGQAGVPFIFLRLLPELYPDIFGDPEERFARFGYAPDVNDPGRPLPLGLGWSSSGSSPVQVVTITCGGCHIGHVRLGDGSPRPLVGAPNTRIDVRAWRHAFERVAEGIQQKGIVASAADLRRSIENKPANYFYGNRLSMGGRADDQLERQERAFVAVEAEPLLQSFVDKTLAGRAVVMKQKATAYARANAPSLDGGTPGQSDGSGDLLPKLVLLDYLRRECGDQPTSDCSHAALASFSNAHFDELPHEKATATDILSTWRQDHHLLAQIDGTVKSPFFRNIAAILAVVGDPRAVNARNAEVSARFLRQLPPPVFPFEVDMQRAARGRVLFQQHCAVCHKAGNTIAYRAAQNDGPESRPGIGTDPNRSQVLNGPAVKLFVRYFRESVPVDFQSTGPDGKTFSPRALPDDAIIIDRSQPQDQGYVTDALDGVWARAPYLHNGSVPTLYHLLAPNSRPKCFVRGSIQYDPRKVGWQWEIDQLDALKAKDPSAARFETWRDGCSSVGHNQNLTVDSEGRIVRGDWLGQQSAGTRRVRLNWSDPDQQSALRDLLEYLKTL